jgi:hypothetical protein
MKSVLNYLFISISALTLLGSCVNYRRGITDEIILKDENSLTGTITESDSTKLKLRKIDESITVIKWADIDTIVGKKLKTVFVGANLGYYNIPYFSVFRNEAMSGNAAGFQFKIGYAFRSNNLFYFTQLFSPATPYSITKTGFGYQRYLGNSTYLKKYSFFVGGEFNLMNVANNNGAQATIEPFTGYELRLAAHVRVHFKFGLQLNLANKNSAIGSNFSIGFHFMRKNFKKRYNYLNTEHRIYGQ